MIDVHKKQVRNVPGSMRDEIVAARNAHLVVLINNFSEDEKYA